FAQGLVATGIDALNIGVGWHESPVPTVQGAVPSGAFVPWAEGLKRAITGTPTPSASVVGVPVIAGNWVNRLSEADAILAGGGVDLVSMSRPFLADPRIIEKGRDGEAMNLCISCDQACIDRSLVGGHVSCLVNPRSGYEVDFPAPSEMSSQKTAIGAEKCELETGAEADAEVRSQKAADSAAKCERTGGGGGGRGRRRDRYVVVGGGPAGMEAARGLATLGGDVHLYGGGGGVGREGGRRGWGRAGRLPRSVGTCTFTRRGGSLGGNSAGRGWSPARRTTGRRSPTSSPSCSASASTFTWATKWARTTPT